MVSMLNKDKMGREKDRKVKNQNKQISFNQTSIRQIIHPEVQEQAGFESDQVSKNVSRQGTYIKNYFEKLIQNQTDKKRVLIALSKLTNSSTQLIYSSLTHDELKIISKQGQLDEVMRTRGDKFDVCFSRKFKQTQTTIYIIFNKFLTPQKTHKMRILILNQRGIILQIRSNLNPLSDFKLIATNLKKSFGSLPNLVIIFPFELRKEVDVLKQFQDCFKKTNVFLVIMNNNLKKYNSLSQNPIKKNDTLQQLYIQQFGQRQGILWLKNQRSKDTLNQIFNVSKIILKRHYKVQQLFTDYKDQFGLDQFNQKQFLLRAFGFYFNFITLKKQMNQSRPSTIKDTVIKYSLDYQELKKDKALLHMHSTNNLPLPCPVCEKEKKQNCEIKKEQRGEKKTSKSCEKKKSKNYCIKCCQQFNKKFGLCANKCFQQFHANRYQYARQVYQIGRPLDQKPDYTQLGSDSRIRSIEQIRQKWMNSIKQNEVELDKFFRARSMNFVAKPIADRIDFLRQQIQLINNQKIKAQLRVKQQQ